MIINTCILLEIRCEFLFKFPDASQAVLNPLPPPLWFGLHLLINPLTLISDQDRISPDNINIIPTR